jgi:hypothetical protein
LLLHVLIRVAAVCADPISAKAGSACKVFLEQHTPLTHVTLLLLLL